MLLVMKNENCPRCMTCGYWRPDEAGIPRCRNRNCPVSGNHVPPSFGCIRHTDYEPDPDDE